MLNNIVYLLTTLNNVGSKTLYNPVFINPEQVLYFLLCMSYKYFHFLSSHASLKQEQELMRVDKREFVREFSLTIDQMKTRVA